MSDELAAAKAWKVYHKAIKKYQLDKLEAPYDKILDKMYDGFFAGFYEGRNYGQDKIITNYNTMRALIPPAVEEDCQ